MSEHEKCAAGGLVQDVVKPRLKAKATKPFEQYRRGDVIVADNGQYYELVELLPESQQARFRKIYPMMVGFDGNGWQLDPPKSE